MTTADTGATFDAAEKIDSLLRADDGQLLASIAFYKTSVLELFGREGLVEMLRDAVDAAPNVDYFSRRSRREIDPGRPEVNLKVDDAGAWDAVEGLAARMRQSGVHRAEDLGTGATEDQHRLVVTLKTSVVFEQVCRPLASRMNEALAPHWEKARGRLVAQGLDESMVRLLLTNMFVLRVAQDAKVASRDKMVTLGLFV